MSIANPIADDFRNAPPELGTPGSLDHYNYRYHPVEWCERFLGVHLYSRQKEVARALAEPAFDDKGAPAPKKVAVAAAHSVGKTYLAAAMLNWTFFTHPGSKCLVTAPNMKQATNNVMANCKSQIRNSPMPELLPCKEYKYELRMKMPGRRNMLFEEWRLFPQTAKDSTSFQGIHGPTVAGVVDETVGITRDLFTGVMSLGHTPTSWVLLIGNPTERGGVFHNACRGQGGFRPFKISVYDTPNFTGEPVHRSIQNLITPGWLRQNIVEIFGKESTEYQTRALAEFPQDANNAVFPISFIEGALDREPDPLNEQQRAMGLDPAHEGPDLTAWVGIFGHRVEIMDVESKTADSIDSAEKTYRMMSDNEMTRIGIDKGGGFGRTFRDVLKRKGNLTVSMVDFSSKPLSDIYYNRKAELYWNLREWLKDKAILDRKCPQTMALVRELESIEFVYDDLKLKIEPKAKTKERLGRSPDRVDALAIAVYMRESAHSLTSTFAAYNV